MWCERACCFSAAYFHSTVCSAFYCFIQNIIRGRVLHFVFSFNFRPLYLPTMNLKIRVFVFKHFSCELNVWDNKSGVCVRGIQTGVRGEKGEGGGGQE